MTWLSDAVVGHLRDVATRPEMPADRYVLLEPIGRGGMGTVYSARDELLGRHVAIKVSNSAAPAGDLERRLRQEARVLATLEHPGIVPVHDAGVMPDGRLFYVMKLVRGQTLTAVMKAGRDEAGILTIFERIAETVAFAHAAGIVHRDVKPSNVMVGSFGEVLVLDWGVARLLDGESGPAARAVDAVGRTTGATEAGTRIGTPGFMSPEQQRGVADVGPSADVYALGALVAWMFTGEAPGPTNAERLLQTGSPAPPRRLAAIVLKCLASDPLARYADAGALVADLVRYRAGHAVTAHRETMFDRLERWFDRYRTAILLVAAYLVMRTMFALFSR